MDEQPDPISRELIAEALALVEHLKKAGHPKLAEAEQMQPLEAFRAGVLFGVGYAKRRIIGPPSERLAMKPSAEGSQYLSDQLPLPGGPESPSGWWYLDFANEHEWLGGCFVQARNIRGAIGRTWDLEINPGGSVQGEPLSVEDGPPPERFRDRLLTKDELRECRDEHLGDEHQGDS